MSSRDPQREERHREDAGRIVCPYCGMSTWIDGHCALPGCEGYEPLPDAAEGGETDSHDDPEQAAPTYAPGGCPFCDRIQSAKDLRKRLRAPSNGSVSSRPSPGADPRVEAAAKAIWQAPNDSLARTPLDEVDGSLHRLYEHEARLALAADEAAGIIRVDTRDEALKREVAVWIVDDFPEDTTDMTYLVGLVFSALAALAGEQ